MSRSLKFLLLSSLILIFSTAFHAAGQMPLSVAATQAATASKGHMPRYAMRGPYSVGRSWFMLDKGTDQALLLIAWYPALKQTGEQTGSTLAVPDEYQIPNMKAMAKLTGWGAAPANAAPDTSGAPYPLVIFSPGYSASAKDYINLEELLASYGFIVLVPAIGSDGPVWKHFIARPVVIRREIDFAENLSSRDGSFKGLIDTKHIGVAGHSAGGYTALAAAGAQFNFAWSEKWCADHKDSPDAEWACADLLGHKQDMLALAKLDSMPQTVWPSWGDPRVTAIVSQAGGAFVFGPSGLASVTIPVMVQVGSDDAPEWSAYLTYDSVSSTQKAQVVFEGADHMIFVDNFIRLSTQDLIHHFTTAFLLDVLKGDKEAHKALLPDAVQFVGIQYKTTMK